MGRNRCGEIPGLYEQRDKGLVIGNFIDNRIEKEFRDGQFDVSMYITRS